MGEYERNRNMIRPLTKEKFKTYTDWYSYMINKYIPGQGSGEMQRFIDLGFDMNRYLFWLEFLEIMTPDDEIIDS